MNIGLNAGTVRAHDAPLFNVFLIGITQDVAIYHLPGLIRYALNIAIQGRFFEAFLGNADATKPPQAARIDDVEGQVLISETEKRFDDDTSQHLVSTHTLGAGALGLGLTCVQVLQNILTDGRVCIDDATDDFQLLALGMIKNVGHQRHLFLPFFAHFVTSSFFVFVVILISWQLSIYYSNQKIATTKCAFFIRNT
jgi:hypothetical protein